MVGVNVIAADTDEEAKRLATSQQLQFLSLIRGTPGKLKPPVDNMDELWQPHEREALLSKFNFGAIGGKAAVEARMNEILKDTMADELIVTSQIYDHKARLRSFEIIAEAGNLHPTA